MIRVKPVEVVQVVGAILTTIGLLMLLPLGAVCLIVGLSVLAVGTFAEVQSKRTPAVTPAPTSPTEGS